VRFLFVFALLATSNAVFGLREHGDLASLISRANSASIDQQVHLYTEIAELEVRSADELYSSDSISKAHAAVDDAVAYAEKASKAAVESGKRLKDTEIAMRKMSLKLRDMKRKLSLEDQVPLQQAADHLENLRTSLLDQMFRNKK
jgi:hypothetical protein